MRGATDPRAPRSETIQPFVCRSQVVGGGGGAGADAQFTECKYSSETSCIRGDEQTLQILL